MIIISRTSITEWYNGCLIDKPIDSLSFTQYYPFSCNNSRLIQQNMTLFVNNYVLSSSSWFTNDISENGIREVEI